MIEKDVEGNGLEKLWNCVKEMEEKWKRNHEKSQRTRTEAGPGWNRCLQRLYQLL